MLSKLFQRLENYDYMTFRTSSDFFETRIKSRHHIGIIKRVLAVLRQTYLSRKRYVFSAPDEEIAFFWSTRNQKLALEPIFDQLKSEGVSCTSVSIVASEDATYKFPLFLANILSLTFLPVALIYLISKIYSKQDMRRFKCGIDQIILGFGFEFLARKYLKSSKIKAIVVSNDHSMQCRVLIAVAKELDIKSIYVQHASVSNHFPSLDQFDLALLDGLNSRRIYEQVGDIPDNTFEVGIAKLDFYKRRAKRNSNNKTPLLGIALNSLVEEAKLFSLLDTLSQSDCRISLRFHPSQLGVRDQLVKKLGRYHLHFSLPEKEDVFEYILSLDAVIAGNSNILLEAAILGVTPIYSDLDRGPEDYYGFVRSGVASVFAQSANHEDNACGFSLNFTPDSSSLKKFDASVGEDFYGFSSVYASDLIKRLGAQV